MGIIVVMVLLLVVHSMRDSSIIIPKTTEQDNEVDSESLSELTIQDDGEEDPRIEQARKNKIPTIVVSDKSAKAGDTVLVKATIVNNPGVLGMSLTLSYDESALKLTNVKCGDAFAEVLNMSSSKELGTGCIFLWDGEYLKADQIQDGDILLMEFQVLESAPVGKTPVLLISDMDSTVNNDLEILDIAMENGFITVEEK